MLNLEKIREEKIELLKAIITEIEEKDKTIIQAQKEKQQLESQGLILQGAIIMLDDLIANEKEVSNTEDKKGE